jgi:hypothetical protein
MEDVVILCMADGVNRLSVYKLRARTLVIVHARTPLCMFAGM